MDFGPDKVAEPLCRPDTGRSMEGLPRRVTRTRLRPATATCRQSRTYLRERWRIKAMAHLRRPAPSAASGLSVTDLRSPASSIAAHTAPKRRALDEHGDARKLAIPVLAQASGRPTLACLVRCKCSIGGFPRDQGFLSLPKFTGGRPFHGVGVSQCVRDAQREMVEFRSRCGFD
jgi:hypothetical protein